MKVVWENNGEADDKGFYTVCIVNAAGQTTSRYHEKDKEVMLQKALESVASGNLELSKAYRSRNPDQGRAPLRIATKELTPGDRMRIASEITDPEKVVDAIAEAIGGTPLGKRFSDMDEEEQNAYYLAEAEAFKAATPLYYPVQQNQELLIKELERRRIDLTRNNLSIVFQALWDEGKLIAWPQGENDEEESGEPGPAQATPLNGASSSVSNRTPEPNSPPPTSRPRNISTVIRSSDASGSEPPPPKPKKITHADIDKMSRAEYIERLRNPDFKRQVDALGV